MIVIGVKADGTRWLLDTFIAQHEPEKEITPRLRLLLAKGISPDVYWVADAGSGIQAALRKIKARNVGTCTTHAVRLIVQTLPDEATEERFRLKIHGALSEDRRDAALQALDAVEAELRELGHGTQADTLKRHKEGMVVTQKLGLKGELRKQLRSTDVLVEGQNRTVKKNLRDVSKWKDDAMRIRWVAKWGLEAERYSWRRLADPKALVDLGERLGLTGSTWGRSSPAFRPASRSSRWGRRWRRSWSGWRGGRVAMLERSARRSGAQDFSA